MDGINLINSIKTNKIIIKCPKCGNSYYSELYSTSTALGWAPIYKDGQLINKNPNIITTYYQCLECGENFNISNKNL